MNAAASFNVQSWMSIIMATHADDVNVPQNFSFFELQNQIPFILNVSFASAKLRFTKFNEFLHLTNLLPTTFLFLLIRQAKFPLANLVLNCQHMLPPNFTFFAIRQNKFPSY